MELQYGIGLDVSTVMVMVGLIKAMKSTITRPNGKMLMATDLVIIPREPSGMRDLIVQETRPVIALGALTMMGMVGPMTTMNAPHCRVH